MHMSWQIVSGPDRAPWDGVDATGWVYALEDGEQRWIVLVEVSGPAQDVFERQPQHLAPVTREALETRGRSEVVKFLDEARPPRRISLGAEGYLVRG